jgi:hypothetical protein
VFAGIGGEAEQKVRTKAEKENAESSVEKAEVGLGS